MLACAPIGDWYFGYFGLYTVYPHVVGSNMLEYMFNKIGVHDCQDTMVLYQSKLQARQLRTIWLISLLMKIQQREGTPNINIISGIHYIKGKTSVNILVSNYTNKHIKFNKGEYIGHLGPAITDSMPSDQSETHPTNSVILQKMMAEQVQQETFNPPCHNLKPSIEFKLKALMKEYALQFAKDKMTIGTASLTEMTIDTGTSDPVSEKPYPIAMKNYEWVKEEIEKLLTAKVICSSQSSWSAPIIVVPKGDAGKYLVIDYHALNKVARNFTWPMPKVEDIFQN